MGLKLATTFRGMPLPDAYFRVSNVSCSKEQGVATVGVFASQEVANATPATPNLNVLGYTEYPFTYDLTSADNAIKQAYDYVKTLPEFEGAVDLLDD